ncbi:probably inactive leucine-rich repeat receptor-like protein kinase At3g28040 [Zingiber officinale]|uniref:Protein kinase domain-containing protein n=1 Tax=Zingiber officinale TaxID=94328 RepID=A0A8J5M182_ZINOF|nr:probably inactive leucine-rich repeat receptor-like protein kinase At3g28040 [Zingiber officinale]KAG6531191.1 hypothetical protein ZIOFF_004965 [Zingiber officinale]
MSAVAGGGGGGGGAEAAESGMRLPDDSVLLLRQAFLIPVLLLLSSSARGSALAPLDDEVLGLIVFKFALDDPAGALASWNEADASPCHWRYVTCDAATSRVVGLSLPDLSLSGSLPRGLDRLPSLSSLSLAGNNLSGPIPSGLSLLPSLRSLDLSRNAFSGRLPDDLSLLSSVLSVDLSSNSLSGPLPSFPASLRFLSLADNRLEGVFPPLSQCPFLLHLNVSGNGLSGQLSGLQQATRLRALDLSRNSFSGTIPDGISDQRNLKILRLTHNQFEGTVPVGLGLCSHLETLDISFNSLDGNLPDTFQSMTSLTFLALSDNKLSGDFPAWIGNLSALQHLDLSNNQLTGPLPESLGGLKGLNYLNLDNNLLTGQISDAVAECSKLSKLRLKGNKLSGSIPHGVFNLGLEVLDLASNYLSGAVPPPSTRMSETLRSLDLSSNRLTGAIPPEMATLSSLRYLNFSSNEFQAPMPSEFSRFHYLAVLDLRNCRLYGTIPRDLCDSGSLSVLQLDYNSLTGSIPDEIGNCSSLYFLGTSHNSLSGSIPASMSRLKKLEFLNLEFNNLSGEIPQQLGGLDSLLAVNISHNRLTGRLPEGGIFPSLGPSALQGNLGLCTPLVNEPCIMNVPKPLVLDPDSYPRNSGMVTVGADADPSSAAIRHRKFLSVSSLVAISAALVIAVGVVVVTLFSVSARRRIVRTEAALDSKVSSSIVTAGATPAVGKIVLFGARTYRRCDDFVGSADALLAKATEVGSGVFGTLYRAPIGRDGGGRAVAVKKLIAEDLVHYHDDFDREIRALAKARHPKLMPLRGYYWTPQLQLLITDYIPYGSLHSMLHDPRPATSPALSWHDRFNIVMGTAEGLAHLHHAFRPPLVHYNLKSTNILLDVGRNPVLSDFGLAKLVTKPEKYVNRARLQGSGDYMAPELASQSVRVNEKCDVYSFGVVMLEVVTGRRPVEYREEEMAVLVDQVRVALEQGSSAAEWVDPSMGEFPEEEVVPALKLGLVCASHIPSSRPTMAEVVQVLQVIRTPVTERMKAF